jgi:septal ring factor EnvC (AmiA/AmiB activator)
VILAKRLVSVKYFALFCSIAALVIAPLSFASTQNELKGVKSEISRQQQELNKQNSELDSLQGNLKKQELEISGIEKQIKQSEANLAQANRAIKQLEQEIEQLTEQKKQQTDKLKQLLDTYYVTRNSGDATELFSDSSEKDRLSQYYQHLASQRSDTITALNTTHQQLSDKQQALVKERDTITTLLNEQTAKRDQLAKTQQQRKSTLNKIKSSISSDKVYLAELQRNEVRLKSELAKAAKRNSVPMDGIEKQKGRLDWPIKGRLLHRFGTTQTGQIDWKGIVIAANYGQQVKAVYPGTVVFSEYLRGYGLVVLLDHGKGDMTLYGFNQTLVKKEGDKVLAGETIALAGDTGGQPQASLYFEIRRNSKAQNPQLWLSK